MPNNEEIDLSLADIFQNGQLTQPSEEDRFNQEIQRRSLQNPDDLRRMYWNEFLGGKGGKEPTKGQQWKSMLTEMARAASQASHIPGHKSTYRPPQDRIDERVKDDFGQSTARLAQANSIERTMSIEKSRDAAMKYGDLKHRENLALKEKAQKDKDDNDKAKLDLMSEVNKIRAALANGSISKMEAETKHLNAVNEFEKRINAPLGAFSNVYSSGMAVSGMDPNERNKSLTGMADVSEATGGARSSQSTTSGGVQNVMGVGPDNKQIMIQVPRGTTTTTRSPVPNPWSSRSQGINQAPAPGDSTLNNVQRMMKGLPPEGTEGQPSPTQTPPRRPVTPNSAAPVPTTTQPPPPGASNVIPKTAPPSRTEQYTPQLSDDNQASSQLNTGIHSLPGIGRVVVLPMYKTHEGAQSSTKMRQIMDLSDAQAKLLITAELNGKPISSKAFFEPVATMLHQGSAKNPDGIFGEFDPRKETLLELQKQIYMGEAYTDSGKTVNPMEFTVAKSYQPELTAPSLQLQKALGHNLLVRTGNLKSRLITHFAGNPQVRQNLEQMNLVHNVVTYANTVAADIKNMAKDPARSKTFNINAVFDPADFLEKEFIKAGVPEAIIKSYRVDSPRPMRGGITAIRKPK